MLEVDRLILGRFGAGSGVLLRWTSGSSLISFLLPGFFDIFVEMLTQSINIFVEMLIKCWNTEKNQNGLLPDIDIVA